MIGSLKRSSGAGNSNSETGINRIVEGTYVEGTIKSDSNLRIDGEFKGNLITKGRLVVGLTGKVSGTVSCLCCDVEGTLEGEVTVLELLSIKSSSTVQGDLYYGQLAVEAGAKALGTFRMGASKGKTDLLPVNKQADKEADKRVNKQSDKQADKQANKQPQETASKADALASLKASTMPSESNSLLIDKVTVGAK